MEVVVRSPENPWTPNKIASVRGANIRVVGTILDHNPWRVCGQSEATHTRFEAQYHSWIVPGVWASSKPVGLPAYYSDNQFNRTFLGLADDIRPDLWVDPKMTHGPAILLADLNDCTIDMSSLDPFDWHYTAIAIMRCNNCRILLPKLGDICGLDWSAGAAVKVEGSNNEIYGASARYCKTTLLRVSGHSNVIDGVVARSCASMVHDQAQAVYIAGRGGSYDNVVRNVTCYDLGSLGIRRVNAAGKDDGSNVRPGVYFDDGATGHVESVAMISSNEAAVLIHNGSGSVGYLKGALDICTKGAVGYPPGTTIGRDWRGK